MKEIFRQFKEEEKEITLEAFDELCPEEEIKRRLFQVFLQSGAASGLDDTKELSLREQEEASADFARILNEEYWIDNSAAKMICDAYLGIILGKAAPDEDSPKALADAYYYGNGVPCDKEKAAELYAEAGEAGDGDACYSLGYMWDKGDGLDKDRVKAMEWYEKAMELGSEDATNRLAVLKQIMDKAAAREEAPQQPKKKRGFFSK